MARELDVEASRVPRDVGRWWRCGPHRQEWRQSRGRRRCRSSTTERRACRAS